MKIAIIGSRGIVVNNLENYLPKDITEIVSGGAKGVDACAKNYAIKKNIKLKEFLPEYNKYGKVAPLKRNIQIVKYADEVIAFWDGKSRGTKYVIEICKKLEKKSQFFYVRINFQPKIPHNTAREYRAVFFTKFKLDFIRTVIPKQKC